MSTPINSPKFKPYYECHITLIPDSFSKTSVEALKWIYSEIAGDPDLGPGARGYATRQFNARLSEDTVRKRLHETAQMLRIAGQQVVREKIEKVIFDRREGEKGG